MDVKTRNNIATSVYVQDLTKLVCQSALSSLLHACVRKYSDGLNRAKEPYFEGLCIVLDPFYVQELLRVFHQDHF